MDADLNWDGNMQTRSDLAHAFCVDQHKSMYKYLKTDKKFTFLKCL
jgi:hypothetical protein